MHQHLKICWTTSSGEDIYLRPGNALPANFDFRLFGTENEIQYSVPQPLRLALKVIAEMTKS